MVIMRVAAFYFGLILCQETVYAQQLTDPTVREAERLQEREVERQREREQQFRDSQNAAPSGAELQTAQPETVADTGQCVAVKSIKINGMTRYPANKFDSAIQALVNDCTSIGKINDALRVITNRYIADGYVTSRALIGPQDLNDGILDITVIEGSLENVKSLEGGYGSTALSLAFPKRIGKFLNLRDIEQGVDQLSRLPSYNPTIDIEPGSLPGSSNVVVNRQAQLWPFRPSLSLNNDGSLSTGRIQSNLGLDADNVFGLADFWSLYYSRSVEDESVRGSEGFGGFVSAPYGYWTLSANGGYFSYESVLDANGQQFSNDGKSWNASGIIDRVLFRDSKVKISASGTLAISDIENRIQGIRLSTSSYRLVTVAIDGRLQRLVKRGLINAALGLTRGVDILGANSADTGPGGPGLTFWVVDASVGYRQQVKLSKANLRYSALLRGQSALDPVFSGQRFSLGGSSTVRGFRDDGISGRHGASFRQQVDAPVLSLFKDSRDWKSDVSGFVGYDAGGIFRRGDDRFERGFLQSVTAGLRFSGKFVNLEFSASRPLSAPEFVTKKDFEFSFSARIGM